LDAKKSPLALLAQTCSSIGKDASVPSSSSKTSAGGGDKKDHRSTSSRGAGDSHSHKDGGVTGGNVSRSKPDSPSVSGGTKNRHHSGGGDVGTKEEHSVKTKDSTSRSSSGDESSPNIVSGGGSKHHHNPHLTRHIPSVHPLPGVGGRGVMTKHEPCSPPHTANSSSGVVCGVGGLHREHSSSRNNILASISASAMASNNNNNLESNYLNMLHDSGLLHKSFQDMPPSSSAAAVVALGVHHHLQRLHQESLAAAAFHSAAVAGMVGPGLVSPGQGSGLPASGYPGLFYGHPALLAAAMDPALMYSASMQAAAAAGLSAYAHKPTGAHGNGGGMSPGAGAAGLSPYVGYARVGTASGGSTLVAVCKDPYCSSASSLHAAHPSPMSVNSICTSAGCTQCTADKGASSHPCTMTTSSVSSQYPSLYPLPLHSASGGHFGLGGVGTGLGLSNGAGLGGLGGGAYVCSWLFGGEFCGKRFQSSEDLLQHLRSTHASVSGVGDPAAASPLLSAFPPLHGLPLLPGFHHPSSYASLPGGGGSLSPGGGQSPYTPSQSLSPASLLSSAPRYHPYKSPFPSSLLSSMSSLGAIPGSALGAYYSSPYVLFNHRLGAAAAGP